MSILKFLTGAIAEIKTKLSFFFNTLESFLIELVFVKSIFFLKIGKNFFLFFFNKLIKLDATKLLHPKMTILLFFFKV